MSKFLALGVAMSCPLAVFDDASELQMFSGAKITRAKPHPLSMPKHLDKDKVLDDYRASLDFLLSYSASPDTFKSYRREVDRFILWLWFIHKDHLDNIKRGDIESYLDFIRNPPLQWIGTERSRRFHIRDGIREPNESWKPFVVSIPKSARKRGQELDEKAWKQSSSALKSTMAILRTYFEYLLDEEIVNRNPVAQIKARSRKATSSQRTVDVKRLTDDQISSLFNAVDSMQIRLGQKQYERLRFILSCMVSMYLRISEIASPGDRQPVHGDFFYRIHAVGSGQEKTWWFRVTGKGNKEREIPVSDELLEQLKRYRETLGLTPLPSIGDSLPLFQKDIGKGGLTSSRHVRSMLQDVFDTASLQLRNDGRQDDADALMSCTAHWLRHTGISIDVQHRPLSHVRDGAGHASIATTGIYVENDSLEIHKSAQKSSILKRR